jgi:hypothetical protein
MEPDQVAAMFGGQVVDPLETFKTRTPENTDKFFRKELVGDGVAKIVDAGMIISKKNGKKWFILKGEVINAIPDKKGRETSLEAGDDVSFFYDPEKDSAKLQDTLFTAGITIPEDQMAKIKSADELFSTIGAYAKDRLIYVSCWMAPKKKAAGDGTWEDVPGPFVQRMKINSANLITEDTSGPQVAF